MRFILGVTTLLFVSAASALPAPEYLSVPGWKACAATERQGSADFVCLPVEKPASCLSSSWDVLTKKKLIPACERNGLVK